MDLEVREIPPQSRGMYSNRMRSYKQEMGKLETDFVSQIRSFIILASLYSDCHIFFFLLLPPHTFISIKCVVFRSLCQRHATAAIVLLVGLADDGLEGMLDS